MVALGILVLASLIVLFGVGLGGENSETVEFYFGTLAFVIAISGAIWIAKRFDESEEKMRKERQKPSR